jgi:ABC-type multidrug transport system fused ATPase/permease subunit
MVVILGAIYWTKADEGLSIAEAFTSLSIISLATQPLLVMLTALAQIGGVFGSSMRIQKFLLLEEQKDTRTTAEKSSASGAPKPAPEAGFGSGITGDAALELKQLVPAGVSGSDLEPAIVIRGATFKAEGGTELLHGIDLEVKQGTVTMIVSRVGGGKSSLLRAIIGDLTPESGTVTVAAGSSAYCDQVTWLRNATIRDNVLGQTPLDEVWLTEVVQACALDQDFAALSDGDATVVGSGGVALSGGQRQRIVSKPSPVIEYD